MSTNRQTRMEGAEINKSLLALKVDTICKCLTRFSSNEFVNYVSFHKL